MSTARREPYPRLRIVTSDEQARLQGPRWPRDGLARSLPQGKVHKGCLGVGGSLCPWLNSPSLGNTRASYFANKADDAA
jgi:hypothetical protein